MTALLVLAMMVCAFALGWVARGHHDRATTRPRGIVLDFTRPDRRRPW